MNFNFLGITAVTSAYATNIHIGGSKWFCVYFTTKPSDRLFAVRTPFFKVIFKNGMTYFSERHGYDKPIFRIGNWRLFIYKTK